MMYGYIGAMFSFLKQLQPNQACLQLINISVVNNVRSSEILSLILGINKLF